MGDASDRAVEAPKVWVHFRLLCPTTASTCSCTGVCALVCTLKPSRESEASALSSCLGKAREAREKPRNPGTHGEKCSKMAQTC